MLAETCILRKQNVYTYTCFSPPLSVYLWQPTENDNMPSWLMTRMCLLTEVYIYIYYIRLLGVDSWCAATGRRRNLCLLLETWKQWRMDLRQPIYLHEGHIKASLQILMAQIVSPGAVPMFVVLI